MQFKFCLLVLFISFVLEHLNSTSALARMDTVPGSRYTSGRGSALGDAFIPLVDDGAGALFYNPAGIGKVSYTQIEPFNFQFQVNQDYINIFDRNFYKVTSLSGFAPNLIRKEGKGPGTAGTYFPSFASRGIAFGVLMQSETQAVATGSNINYRSQYLFVPTFGFAIRLASGVVKLGYSLQWVNQASGVLSVPNDSNPLGYNQGLAQGSGLSHTVGFALTLPLIYLPALNIVARNVLGTQFRSYSLVPFAKNKNGVPPSESMTFDASLSSVTKAGAGLSIHSVLEMRDFSNRSHSALFTRLVAGLEFDFRNQFFLRGGFGSGYLSYGLGLKRRTAEFSLSTYSEEWGANYREAPDTRYLLHYQVRVF
jgi:hypothetical protein